ncbi:ABC transporter permease [Asticcacaulis endophyticus]|uniref:Iron ABC transporter permease n=1 Tax=Asticcacaulis endophyticus TaxID=1395890 RepID=A0A918UV13_9CAUL|nr:iron ABC transporter permease [Asticcacaulis endophyticus]GGZ36130.1 iron ABC transporter permease [Asticcacaulis endophyticus]
MPDAAAPSPVSTSGRPERTDWSGAAFKAGAVLAVCVTLLPILAVVYKAFESGQSLNLPDFPVMRYTLTSAALVTWVAVITVALGTVAAWLVAMHEFPGRRFFSWALVLPLACPAFVLAYGWSDFLDVASPFRAWLYGVLGYDVPLNMRNFYGAVFVLSFAYFPYIYLTLKTAFLNQSVCAIETARMLGVRSNDIFLRLSLPICRPALIAGMALVIMECLADYGAVNFLGVQTLTTGVVRAWSVFGSTELAARLALCLIGATAFLLLIERTQRHNRSYSAASARWRELNALPLSRPKQWLATVYCALLLAFGVVIPVAWLIYRAIKTSPDVQRLLDAAVSTLGLSIAGAAITLVLATLVAFGFRKSRAISNLMSIGYATPGAVMAIGLLVPAAILWQGFAIQNSFWIGIALLLIAYAARLMASAFEPIKAGLTRIQPNLALASRTLGATKTQAIRRVELPLVRGTFMAAALLVFVDIAKELPATLILRPFQLESLAVLADRYASDERLSQAAWPSLLILAVSLIPSLYLSLRIDASRTGNK